MVRAIAMTRHGGTAAKLGSDRVDLAERPVTAGLYRVRGLNTVCIARLSSTCGGGSMIRICGGRARVRRFRGSGCLAFLPSNRPSLSNRFTFPHTAARGRRRRYEICAAVLVGHKVTSSRSSSSVQRDMTVLGHGGPSAWCHACRFRAAPFWRLHHSAAPPPVGAGVPRGRHGSTGWRQPLCYRSRRLLFGSRGTFQSGVRTDGVIPVRPSGCSLRKYSNTGLVARSPTLAKLRCVFASVVGSFDLDQDRSNVVPFTVPRKRSERLCHDADGLSRSAVSQLDVARPVAG